MEVSAKVFDRLPKAHTEAEAVSFANGFVCLELIVTGNNTVHGLFYTWAVLVEVIVDH